MVTQGIDGDVEFQPLGDDEDGRELAERRQPAQPQDRIQTDIAVRMSKIGDGNVSHVGSLAAQGRRRQIRGLTAISSLALAADMAQ